MSLLGGQGLKFINKKGSNESFQIIQIRFITKIFGLVWFYDIIKLQKKVHKLCATVKNEMIREACVHAYPKTERPRKSIYSIDIADK